MQSIRNILVVHLFLFSFFALSACGGKGKIQTTDDSTEYHRAEDREPLKRTSTTPVRTEENTLVTLPSQLVSQRGDRTHLEVEASFDETWQWMITRLRDSDITVFARNLDADLFEVGCNGIDSEVYVPQKRKRGWFRKRKQMFEYCALQLSKSRNATIVKVLNRKREEISADNAGEIFARLLGSSE